MKILFIEPRYHTNQIGWVNCLKENNHVVKMHVVSRGNIEDYSALKPDFIKPSLLSRLIIWTFGDGGTNNFRSFPNPINYYYKIKEDSPDLIIVRDINRYISILALFISKLLKKRVLIYSQTRIYKRYSFLRLNFTNFILNFFNSAWVSPVIGDKYKYMKIPNHMYFLPFAVTVDVSKKKIDPNNIKILTIGKFEERKNHLLLLKSLLSIDIKFELLIIGEISKEEHINNFLKIKNFIEKNGLSKKVKIKCNIAHEKIKEYYMKADLFVLPATKEHASISVVESLGYGVPSICSDTNGTKNYIKINQNGFIFEDSNQLSLTSTLKIATSKKTLENVTENLNKNNNPKYSHINFYKTFKEIIKDRYKLESNNLL